MPTSEIKKEARVALKGKWEKAVCITLIFLALSFIIGFIQGMVVEGSVPYLIIELAYLVISIPLSFGLLISFMKLKRGEDVKVFDFFKEGFSRFKKSWGIWFRTFLKLLLPIICVIFLVILMTVLTAYNVIAQNTVSVNLNYFFNIAFVVLYIITIIYTVSRAFSYVLAYNISYDNPELSAKECVLKSEALMKGNRGNYFLLGLSFIGWIMLILVVLVIGTTCLLPYVLTTFGYISWILFYLLTLVLGMAFLMPYVQISMICFYEKVINSKTQKVDEKVIKED